VEEKQEVGLLLSFACPKESNKEKGTRGELAVRHQVKLKIRNSSRMGLEQPNFLDA
jgi:hypothetical protein